MKHKNSKKIFMMNKTSELCSKHKKKVEKIQVNHLQAAIKVKKYK
jgi:hypothetical protein